MTRTNIERPTQPSATTRSENIDPVAFDPSLFEPELEAERYELFESNGFDFAIDRRQFLKSVGGGLVVCLLLRGADAAGQVPGQGRPRGGGRDGAPEIGAWLHVDEAGLVTVYTGKVEVGQNIRTSLTQVVSEELQVPVGSISLVMGDTERTPFDAGTFGSQTTPVMARQLRRVASAAREQLASMAAELWKCDRAELAADNGRIVRAGGHDAIGYGALTNGQKITKAIGDNAATTPADQWLVAGHSIAKVNGELIVTGRHKYASDIDRPNMLHAKVLRAPSFGATLESIDLEGAKSVDGATVVRDGSFVAVAAATEFAAYRAIQAIKPAWSAVAKSTGSSAELFDQLKNPGGGGGDQQGGRGGGNRVGSISDGLAAADVRLDQTYTIAYIAHCPLEPRAAVAEWTDDKLTVWTGTQRPFGVRGELASALRIPQENIRVIVPDTGSGYGGKHNGEAAIEAARIARAVGKPVKLVWTREEEFTWAYFRPAGVIDVRSGVRSDGTLTAWEFHNYNSGGSAIRTLYEVPNQLIEFHSTRAPLRQGSYRALAATANHFARESHMDELAHAIHMDPLAFRLKNLQDARLRAVLEAAASAFDWGRKPPPDHGFGIAGGSEKGSYVATCAEVRVDGSTGRVKVIRAISAFECGAVLNPDHLKNQVEGAMVMGIGGALFEAVEFADGKILNPQFSHYRVPRFNDAPAIEVVLLDRKDASSNGAGETPIVGIAPAIGNAIFAATGIRLRSMPMAPKGVKA